MRSATLGETSVHWLADLSTALVVAVAFLALPLTLLGLLARFGRPVPMGRALVFYRGGRPARVGLWDWDGAVELVVPGLHRVRELDLGSRRLTYARTGARALRLRDGLLELRATFEVHVEARPERILRVARDHGCASANDPARLGEALAPLLEGILEEVAAGRGRAEVEANPAALHAEVRRKVRARLHGFTLGGLRLEALRATGAVPYRG